MNIDKAPSKARITVRQSAKCSNIYTLENPSIKGFFFGKVISNTDIKRHGDLMGYVRYLQSIECSTSAERILKCIRLN